MNESEESMDFLWKVHGYMNDYTRFADRKAGVFLAVVTTIVAYQTTKLASKLDGLDWLLFLFSIAFGGLSFVSGVLVVAPRLFSKNPFTQPWEAFLQTVGIRKFDKGHIYWNEVAKFKDHSDYCSSLMAMGNGDMAKAVARHVHVLSTILVGKYRYLDWQMRFAIVSFGFFVCVYLRVVLFAIATGS